MNHAHRTQPGHEETMVLPNARAAGFAQAPGVSWAFAFVAALMMMACGGGGDTTTANVRLTLPATANASRYAEGHILIKGSQETHKLPFALEAVGTDAVQQFSAEVHGEPSVEVVVTVSAGAAALRVERWND